MYDSNIVKIYMLRYTTEVGVYNVTRKVVFVYRGVHMILAGGGAKRRHHYC